MPVPAEYYGGLQNRYDVVAIAPLAIEEAGAVTFDIAITTTSGTYHVTSAIATQLP